MKYLFIDSTAGLIIGLLDEKFDWLSYEIKNTKKPSEIIHTEILLLLKKFSLSKKDVSLIICSGPGSYTGMRLSEGVAQVFELDGINVFSFAHFEVPSLIGFEKGTFIANAFKSEIYSYKWDKGEMNRKLISKEKFEIDKGEEYFYISPFDQFEEFQSTIQLIKENSEILFFHVVKNKMRIPPFYFRSLEEEFR